ncbi:MAG: hypothetical protein GEU92_04140 [Alphaproteobacteria bacterium]|nr:hypothetical protein [Alphaproteobacteria bacterium]
MAGSPDAFRNGSEAPATRGSDPVLPYRDGNADAHTSLQTPVFRRYTATERPYDLARCLIDEDAARLMMERLRWPAVTICPHCMTLGASRRLNTTTGRAGLWRCGDCRRQFTVTVGTALSSTRIPLNLWVYSIHMLCSCNRGLSAGEIGAELGISYNSARALLNRILSVLDPSDEGTDTAGQGRKHVGRVSLRPRSIPEICGRLLQTA